MGKKKAANVKKSSQTSPEEDNWDEILNEVQQENAASMAATNSSNGGAIPIAKETPPEAVAANAEEDEGEEEGAKEEAEDIGGKKSTNKKKKKKKASEQPTEKAPSARGKLVAERLRIQREEEERLRKLQEEEDRRIAELEAKEAEEQRLREEEKERKKQKQKEKIERQKSEGTYMTKAQKLKAKLAAERIEAMRAAGMIPTTTEVSSKVTAQGQSKLYKKGKGKRKEEQETKHEPDQTQETNLDKSESDEEEIQLQLQQVDSSIPKQQATEQTLEEESAQEDEWDADSFDSSDDKFAQLAAKLQQVHLKGEGAVHAPTEEEEEDLIAAEKKKEQERLRLLGIEREKRDKIEAEKRAAFLAHQEELQRQEMIVAQKKAEGKKRRLEQEKANLAARTRDDLRCPVVVIMGHVDTGKTKLLDKIRHTNVQEGEAGGITQQIGATFFEKKTLEQQTARLNKTENVDLTIPGMLVIDTPGHESFSNLRSRGSSLCDVAILVIDLMHGLEPQTIESLNMLRARGTPFVVALNKIDRCYAWATCPDSPIREALEKQSEGTVAEFRTRASQAKLELAQQGINSNIYWEMGDDDWESSDFIPLVPTSAVSGEGVQDILLLLCQIAQRKLWRQLMWCANLQATVLEVKAIDGLGMTVDVLLVNGYLHEGSRAIFCSLDGPIVTEIRGLLTPPPSREMRIKSEYIHHKKVKGAIGVKIIGNGLDKVMPGTTVMVVGADDEVEDIKAEVMSDLSDLQSKLSTDKKGVMVQASTLGALEALLQFLRVETKPPIPVSAIGIGTIHKKDVTKISIMNEKGCPEYATILAFDVPIERDAREHAAEMGVRIFTADIIYHLFDSFTRFMEDLAERRRNEAAAVAVFPCIIKILPQHIFNQKDPIIVGVEVLEGILKLGTPLCVPSLGGLHVGKVTSIESNGKEQETARKGTSVAVKIVNEQNPTITYGRQFDSTNALYSTLTRQSIDALKENFKDKLDTEDWRLVVKLKKVFNII